MGDLASRIIAAQRERMAELDVALTEAASQLGLDPSTADKWKRKIFRPIADKKTEKLRDWRYRRFIGRRKNELTRAQAAALIGARKRKNKQGPETLTAVEKRAVEILSGLKRKSKKNFIETQAIELAGAIREEWFSSKGRSGRPEGARSQPPKQTELTVADVSLSIDEIIIAIIRATEEVTGNQPPSPVLVAAVRVEKPGASKSSILTIAARIRKKIRLKSNATLSA